MLASRSNLDVPNAVEGVQPHRLSDVTDNGRPASLVLSQLARGVVDCFRAVFP